MNDSLVIDGTAVQTGLTAAEERIQREFLMDIHNFENIVDCKMQDHGETFVVELGEFPPVHVEKKTGRWWADDSADLAKGSDIFGLMSQLRHSDDREGIVSAVAHVVGLNEDGYGEPVQQPDPNRRVVFGLDLPVPNVKIVDPQIFNSVDPKEARAAFDSMGLTSPPPLEPHERTSTFVPALKQLAKTPVFDSSTTIVEAIPELAASNKSETPQMILARQARAEIFDGHLVHDGSGFRTYQGGFWPSLQSTQVESLLFKWFDIDATPSRVRTLTESLRMMYTEPEFGEAKQLICLSNGSLRPVDGELLEHDPGHRLTNRLPIAWNPEANCPLWLQTLDEVFAPDDDKVEKIQLLQEFVGYCLIPDTRMHKFLWLVGAGANGKSVILKVIEMVVGSENIYHSPIERLSSPSTRAELQGKLVNISSEMSAQATVVDGFLKQIVSGDLIDAERKYERPFSFRPYVRLIGATNELPRLLDLSDGFARRPIILKFNRQFDPHERDARREERLQGELAGILPWCVRGLQRLLERGSFVIPPSSTAELVQYRLASDPVKQFAEEFLVQSAVESDWVMADSLYTAYSEWARSSGYAPVSIVKFKARLLASRHEAGRGNRGRYWKVRYSGTAMVDRFR